MSEKENIRMIERRALEEMYLFGVKEREQLEAENEKLEADSERLERLELLRGEDRTWCYFIDKHDDVQFMATEAPVGCSNVKYARTARELLDKLEDQEPQHPGYGVKDDEWMNAPTGRFKEEPNHE